MDLTDRNFPVGGMQMYVK